MSEKANLAATYSASAVTTLAGLTINEWVALAGIGLGVGTFCINWWYKHQHLKLDRNRTHSTGTHHGNE